MAVLANVLQVERFSRHAAFTAVPFLISFALPTSLHYKECVCVYIYIYMYTHISDCVQTVYELLLLPNYTASETIFQNMDRYEVLILYLLLDHQPGE
jgi:hypothetical protein